MQVSHCRISQEYLLSFVFITTHGKGGHTLMGISVSQVKRLPED